MKEEVTLKVELKPYLQVYGDGSGCRSSCKRWVAERIPVNGDVFECSGCTFKIAMKDIPHNYGGCGRYDNYQVEGYILKTDGITLPNAKVGMDFQISLNVLATPKNEMLKVVDGTVSDAYDADEQKACEEK